MKLSFERFDNFNMNSELNEKLNKAKHEIARTGKIDSMVEQLVIEKAVLMLKMEQYKDILDKETNDIVRIEGKSFSKLLHSILGNLVEKTEKERREALAASLKYDEAVQNVEYVQGQIERLTAEKAQYNGCLEKYERYYVLKQEELINSHGEIAQKIIDLHTQLNQSKIDLKEIDEAIIAGNEVLKSLDSALNNLDSAESWGYFDIAGGGFIADLSKHSKIDDATEEIENAQNALLDFKSELADVKINANINISIDEFSKFADVFFDGVFSDFNMQSKIINLKENVDDVRDQVASVIEKLNIMINIERKNEDKIEQELNEIILKT